MLIKPDENPRRPIASFSDDPGFERYTRRSAPGSEEGPGRAPEEDSPPRRGATVFENSTACTLFGRIPADRCVQVRRRRSNAPSGVARSTVPELTPSCAFGALCVLGLQPSPASCRLSGATPIRPRAGADRGRKGLIPPGTGPGLGAVAGRDTVCGRSRLRIFLTTLCGSSSRRV